MATTVRDAFMPPGAGWRRKFRRQWYSLARRFAPSCPPAARWGASRRRRWGATLPISAPKRLGQLLNQRNVGGFLDAATHAHDCRPRPGRRLPRFREKLERPGADIAGGNAGREVLHRRGGCGAPSGPNWSARYAPPAKRRSAARLRRSARPRSPCPEKLARQTKLPVLDACEMAPRTAALPSEAASLGKKSRTW